MKGSLARPSTQIRRNEQSRNQLPKFTFSTVIVKYFPKKINGLQFITFHFCWWNCVSKTLIPSMDVYGRNDIREIPRNFGFALRPGSERTPGPTDQRPVYFCSNARVNALRANVYLRDYRSIVDDPSPKKWKMGFWRQEPQLARCAGRR